MLQNAGNLVVGAQTHECKQKKKRRRRCYYQPLDICNSIRSSINISITKQKNYYMILTFLNISSFNGNIFLKPYLWSKIHYYYGPDKASPQCNITCLNLQWSVSSFICKNAVHIIYAICNGLDSTMLFCVNAVVSENIVVGDICFEIYMKISFNSDSINYNANHHLLVSKNKAKSI